MRNCPRLIVCTALLAAACVRPAFAAPPGQSLGGGPANCYFTTAPGAWGKDPAKPAYPTRDAVACQGPESLYAVCRPASGAWFQYKNAKTFRLEVSLPGSDIPLSREIPAAEVWKNNDAPLLTTLWKPGDKGLAGDFGIDKKQVENLCPEKAGDEDQPPPAIVFAMAWGRAAEQAPNPDAGGSAQEAVMEYEQIGSATLAVDPDLAAAPEVKPVPPPSADAVKDVVRNEWPSRYPDFTYLDGVISDSSITSAEPGGDVFTYAMNVTLQDPDSNQLMCNVRGIRVRRTETGSLQIVDLPFDLIQNCQ